MLDASALAVLQKAKSNFLAELPIKEGVVRATDKKFGFLEVDNNESIFIPPPEMEKVLHGDKVKARIRTDAQGREQAEPFELITPFIDRCVARLYIDKKSQNYMAKIDHPNYNNQILAKVPNNLRQVGIKNGDWVIVTLSTHPLLKQNSRASVMTTELIARADDPKVPWLVSLRKYELPTDCPPDPESLEIIEQYDREDLTDLYFVTIDSADTMDMDDALYIEDQGDSWLLYVAIADPTAYIAPHSPLDEIASQRAFTCYLPGINIPIIPHIFSENICSIMENEDRNVLLARIKVNKDGTTSEDACKFSLATIRSHGKLAYDDVSDYLENNPNEKLKPNDKLASILKIFQEFTLARSKYRETLSVSFKDKLEYHYVLNEQGGLANIEVDPRRIANCIVEEAMILSNECAGAFLAQNLKIGIFNKHTGFDQEKLKSIVKVLQANGIEDVNIDDLKTMEGFFKIKKRVSEAPSGYLEMRLRKFQIPAEITTTPAEHFGLGLKTYATWTSPIRKYGDMINHRLIKRFLAHEEINSDELINNKIIQALNLGKKINRYAERDVKDWLNIDFIEPSIETHKVYEAIINDITRGGIRTSLLENGATVFIPMSLINPNRDNEIVANSDEGRIFNKGEMMYELAMKVKVTVTSIDRANRNIIGDLVI